jgi:hypothetical protein
VGGVGFTARAITAQEVVPEPGRGLGARMIAHPQSTEVAFIVHAVSFSASATSVGLWGGCLHVADLWAIGACARVGQRFVARCVVFHIRKAHLDQRDFFLLILVADYSSLDTPNPTALVYKPLEKGILSICTVLIPTHDTASYAPVISGGPVCILRRPPIGRCGNRRFLCSCLLSPC